MYIGQTIVSLDQRDKRHLQEHDNTYFHRALEKYGRDNFDLEIVEDNIPPEDLDERERYWIKFYDSYYKGGRGYNMTKGGKWGNSHEIVMPSQVDKIQDLLKRSGMTFKEIGDLYNISFYGVADINRGRSFYDNKIDYPIRKNPGHTDINQDNIQTILDLLSTTDLTCDQIGQLLGISSFTVGEINRGSNKWCPSDYPYPIRKWPQPHTHQNLLEPEEIPLIIKDMIFSSLNFTQIGEKYGVARNTISDISRGISWKSITHQFVTPIRTHKEANKEIYSSIYGIV